MDNPFKDWRLQKRYKANFLAEKLGVPPSTVSRIENGSQMPSFETLRKYAELGLNVNSVFLGGDLQMSNNAQIDSEREDFFQRLAEERAEHIQSLKKQLEIMDDFIKKLQE